MIDKTDGEVTTDKLEQQINLIKEETRSKQLLVVADFTLVDNKGREYKPYSDTIGSIENYIDMRNLSPSVKETGYMVYEIPTDATSYSYAIGKAGTKELYKVLLK